MYPIQKTDNGYVFVTEYNVEYLVYFTKVDHLSEYLQSNILIKNYYYFGVERISEKVGCIDPFIKRTIATIIVTFFVENEGSVLIFNYTNAEKRILGKRKLFLNWFREYSTHTLYQFFQYDISDSNTVCALYRRSGGSGFDLMKKNIEDSIANLNKTTKP